MNSFTVLLLGRSGSGKGTQAQLLKEFLEKRDGPESVLYIYTGQELRKLGEQDFLISDFLKRKSLLAGEKAPDFLAVYSWVKVLLEKARPNLHLIFDGSPRTLIEAKIMDECFDFLERDFVYPVLIDVSRQEAFLRLKDRGRSDDNEEAINRRLDFYDRDVLPAVEYYQKESRNKLKIVNGNTHDINKIHQDMLKAIGLVN